MNDLDRVAEPLVVPLVRNRPYGISESDRTLLATWAAKIAILLEHTRPVSDLTKRRSIVPSAAHHELYELRLPPAFSRIWILRVNPPVIGAWWRTGPVPVAWFDPDGARKLGAPNGSMTTFVIGMLGFQFLYAPPTHTYEAFAQRRTRLGSEWMRVLWPPTDPLGWPPAAALDRDALDVIALLRFA